MFYIIGPGPPLAREGGKEVSWARGERPPSRWLPTGGGWEVRLVQARVPTEPL
jgi:hypothetical protein